MKEPPLLRDELLTSFESIWLKRPDGAQPLSLLPQPKQLVLDVITSAYRDFESHEIDLRLCRNAEELCRFQKLDEGETAAVEEVERDRSFAGGTTTDVSLLLAHRKLNEKYEPVIKAEREAAYDRLVTARRGDRADA